MASIGAIKRHGGVLAADSRDPKRNRSDSEERAPMDATEPPSHLTQGLGHQLDGSTRGQLLLDSNDQQAGGKRSQQPQLDQPSSKKLCTSRDKALEIINNCLIGGGRYNGNKISQVLKLLPRLVIRQLLTLKV